MEENDEYQVWNRLAEEEAYWDSLARKFLVSKEGILEFNEYKILENNEIKKEEIKGFKKYLLNRYGILKIKKL